jgi:hypothetical protein
MHVAVRAHSEQGITHEAQKKQQRQTSSKVFFPPRLAEKDLGKNRNSGQTMRSSPAYPRAS